MHTSVLSGWIKITLRYPAIYLSLLSAGGVDHMNRYIYMAYPFTKNGLYLYNRYCRRRIHIYVYLTHFSAMERSDTSFPNLFGRSPF